MTDTLSERELLAWWDSHDARSAFNDELEQLTGRRLGQAECDRLSDLAGEQVMQREDDLLFHVGTLCLLSGQRALWSQIHYLFLQHEGDIPDEDEFAFVDRMTAEARAVLSSSDPPPESTATEPAATVEQAIYARLAALGGPEARRLLDLLARLHARQP